jgi:hypothetical protein
LNCWGALCEALPLEGDAMVSVSVVEVLIVVTCFCAEPRPRSPLRLLSLLAARWLAVLERVRGAKYSSPA